MDSTRTKSGKSSAQDLCHLCHFSPSSVVSLLLALSDSIRSTNSPNFEFKVRQIPKQTPNHKTQPIYTLFDSFCNPTQQSLCCCCLSCTRNKMDFMSASKTVVQQKNPKKASTSNAKTSCQANDSFNYLNSRCHD